MTITEEQRIARRNHIGSSDIGRILGIECPGGGNAADVFFAKTQGISTYPGDNGNAAMDAGNRFEGAVLDWAEAELGPIERDAEVTADGLDFPMRVHTDGMTVSAGLPVEAKTSGLFFHSDRHWGDQGTDDIPMDVIAQCHAHMIATESRICHVPAFLGGRGFVMFHVNRDEELVTMILDACSRFWNEHVVKNIPPMDLVPSINVLKRLRREPEKVVPIKAELVSEWAFLRDSRLKIEKEEKIAYAEVVDALGNAEGGSLGDGSMVTYMRTTSNRFNVKRFRKAHPKLGAEYTEQSSYPILRFKKPKQRKPKE